MSSRDTVACENVSFMNNYCLVANAAIAVVYLKETIRYQDILGKRQYGIYNLMPLQSRVIDL